MALDASGNLFVADGNNNRALVFFSPMPMTAVSNVPGNFGDATADVAIGQADLVSGECNQGGSATLTTLCIGGFFGVGIAADGSDNLYIGDTLNNRALEYNGPFGYEQTNNATADLVFAGNNLAQPSGVAADSNQNFYVSSEAHNQVYEYTQPVPLQRTDLLNLQIGPGAQNPNAASLQFPMGLAVDGLNNLYVADQANNRVLEFNEFGAPGNRVANGAGGQIDRAHNGQNFVDAVGENSPGGIAIDATSQPPHRHLYVADSVNNRVLGWRDVTAFAAAQPADVVLGQPDLFSSKCNNGAAPDDVGGLGADSLCGPARMAVDRQGNLYVADSGNNRVLVYNTPFDASSGGPPGRATRRRILFTGRAVGSRRGAAIRAARMRRRCAIRRQWRSMARGTSILRTRGTVACWSSRRRGIRRPRRMRLRVVRMGRGAYPIFRTRNAPTALLAIRRRAVTGCALRAAWRSMRWGICWLPTRATTA